MTEIKAPQPAPALSDEQMHAAWKVIRSIAVPSDAAGHFIFRGDYGNWRHLLGELRAAVQAPEGAPVAVPSHWLQPGAAIPVTAESVQILRDALRAALAAPAPQAPAWQPIETAPRDGTSVLLFEQYEDVPFVGYWWGNREWRADRTFYDTDGDACVIDKVAQKFVTHWMPLPAAPQTKEPTNDR